MDIDNKQLITGVLFEGSEILPDEIGRLNIEDSRSIKPNIIQTKSIKNKSISFVLQPCSSLNSSIDFFTPNNIGLLRYVYKYVSKKYKLTLINHIEKDDIGKEYKKNVHNKYDELNWYSKMIYEMIQCAEIAVFFLYNDRSLNKLCNTK